MKKYLYAVTLFLILITSVQLLVTQGRTGQKEAMEQIAALAPSAAPVAPEVPAIGGAFSLVDQNGKTVHDTDFRSRIMLVSFGFTRCPDICPITVSTLSKTLELLADKPDQAVGVFISVDPAHDTPAIMKDFLSNFDKHIVGLTGTEGQIKQAADAYKVYYAQAAKDESLDAKAASNNATIDHSGYIYLMGKAGQFLRVFPYNVPEQELAAAVETALK